MEKIFFVEYWDWEKMYEAKIHLFQIPEGKVILKFISVKEQVEFTDELVFVSFCKLRDYLLERNQILLCKGCRTDVHPSGSQLKWIYAYQLKIGIRIDPIKDKTMIFDKEPDMNKIGSVSDQEIYFKKWLKSIEGLPYSE